MLNFSDKFVCETTAFSTYEKNVPAPLFRKSFCVNTTAKRAEILICGVGFYDLFINGKKITKGYLAPYIYNSDHLLYYDNYDLLPYLKEGENVIGVMLGDGHQVGKTSIWDFKDNRINSAPLLALTAEIETENETISFEADEFLCKQGPILFNDLRSGVFYDARLEEENWCTPGEICQENWHKPIVGAYRPRGRKKLCEAEPVTVYREIAPVSVKKGELAHYTASEQMTDFVASITPFETAPDQTGGYLYDFGENNAGIFRLKIRGTRGQKISIQCGEQLTHDGKLNYSNINFYPDGFSQRDIYYLKGDGEEIFEPMFTYHGYRYLYVSGITEEQATKDLVTYLVMSSDLENRGTFHCSDETANAIFEAACRSDRSNFVYFPTDCPHREKNGWTGDAQVSAEHMILTMGTENSWREWMYNIRAAQTESGAIPGIIPTDTWGYAWGNGPAWDMVLFELPYCAYRFRGKTEMITENASAMLRYLEYVSKRRDKDGIIEFGLGDWVPVVQADGKRSDTSLGFTDSIMVLEMCRKGAVMFDAVNLPHHAKFARDFGEELYHAIRRKYICTETMIADKPLQTSQAMAIYYNLFTEEEKPKAFAVLMDIIHKDNNAITSGMLGLRVIFHVLSAFGESDLAYKMLTRKEYPGYGYWIARGETTLLEKFELYDDYFASSKNHHFLGDVSNWFISVLGGICVKNESEVVVRPHFVTALSHCHAAHSLPTGNIEVNWERNGNEITLQVSATDSVRYTVDTAGLMHGETLIIKD